LFCAGAYSVIVTGFSYLLQSALPASQTPGNVDGDRIALLMHHDSVCYFPVLGCSRHHLFVEFLLLFVLFAMGK
jgi:hypothetical protein